MNISTTIAGTVTEKKTEEVLMKQVQMVVIQTEAGEFDQALAHKHCYIGQRVSVTIRVDLVDVAVDPAKIDQTDSERLLETMKPKVLPIRQGNRHA